MYWLILPDFLIHYLLLYSHKKGGEVKIVIIFL